VDVVESVGADEESASVVQPGEGAFHDPAVAAEAGAVLGLAACDQGCDPARAQTAPIGVVVVAAVGKQGARTGAWSAAPAAYGRDTVEQVEQLRAVVAVSPGHRPGKRHAAAVYEEMMLAPPAATIDGTGTRFRAPFFACR
jgi:hypothetical protein